MRKIQRKKIIILMYHGITAEKNRIANFDHKHVHLSTFERQIQYLKKYYHIISIDDLLQWYDGQGEIPDNSVVLTFDDGYKNCYTRAFPILQKYTVPATIFLPIAYINKKKIAWYDIISYCISKTAEDEITILGKRYMLVGEKAKKAAIAEIKEKIKHPAKRKDSIMQVIGQTKCDMHHIDDEDFLFLSWEECDKMSQKGVSFGAHSMTHEVLPLLTESMQKREILLSKKALEKKGYHCPCFAYPFGEAINDLFLEEAGYKAGLTTQYGKNVQKTNIMRLNRISVTNLYSLNIFALNLLIHFSSFHYYLVRLYSKYKKIVKL